MTKLTVIQDWLRESGFEAFVVPSGDAFLSEFAPPAERRLRWATGFRGSTGLAVIARNAAALFLDPRYFLQGVLECDTSTLTVLPATLDARREWIRNSISNNGAIALDAALHSQPDIEQWRSVLTPLGLHLTLLAANPLDQLWPERPSQHRPAIVDYPVRYAGEAYENKIGRIIEHLIVIGADALLVSDPEDVSWLLNVRAAGPFLKTPVGEWHVVPSCASRAIVYRDGVSWFIDDDRPSSDVIKRSQRLLRFAPASMLDAALLDAARNGTVALDTRRTPAALKEIADSFGGSIADDFIARHRWRKHSVEVENARIVHVVDATAVVRAMAWITRVLPTRTVTEFEVAEMLEGFRAEHPDYIGASMPLMSASGPNGALPHYVPKREACRRLNDHPIYWMDSGGQYLGGTTDNTITLAVGPPEPKHIRAHTAVLKAVISLSMACVPIGASGIQLDTIARQMLWRSGLDFAHATGHGVGNYLNIHEGPGIGRDPGPGTLIGIEPGMIIANEPAFYEPNDFGLRIETHLTTIPSRHDGFVEFETISRLPIDPSLVDFDLLSPSEHRWLADYHRTVVADLTPLLDAPVVRWLREFVAPFFIGTPAHSVLDASYKDAMS